MSRKSNQRARRAVLTSGIILMGLSGCMGTSGAKDPGAGGNAASRWFDRLGESISSRTTVTDNEFPAAEDLYRQERFSDAERAFRKIADNTNQPPLVAEKARYYQAECLRRNNELPDAADTYNRMLKDFPTGVMREQGVTRMYEIGREWLADVLAEIDADREKNDPTATPATPAVKPAFLSGLSKSKPFIDSEGRALELLEKVWYNDPTGPAADQALFLGGYIHFYRVRFNKAYDLFSQLIESMPNSKYRVQAFELAILSKNNRSGGPDYDGRKPAEALRMINSARVSMPELKDRGEFLDRQTVMVRLQQAEKDFNNASFYQRTGHPGSAYFCYELVTRRYPGTRFAELAEAQKAVLKSELDTVNDTGEGGLSGRMKIKKYVLGHDVTNVRDAAAPDPSERIGNTRIPAGKDGSPAMLPREMAPPK